MNLEHPRTYNEKHDRNPLMAQCCDKYAVREYVESKGCGEYLNDLLWQGFDPEEIPFDELPDQYVVKVTSFDEKMGDWLKLPCDEVA